MISCRFRRYCTLVFLFTLFLTSYAPKAEALEPAYPQAAFEALQAGKMQEALDVMQYAVTENPQNLEYQYTLGVVYLRLDRLDEAELIFQALLLQEGEQYRKVNFDRALISVKRGNDREARGSVRHHRVVPVPLRLGQACAD